MSDIVERLAPCPFCGEVLTKVESWAKSFQPARLYHEYHHPDNGCIMVTDHPALFWAGPATDAPAFIAAWNRRSDATITALREEVGRLREVNKITREVEAHHLQRALTAEAELTALRQRVVEVVKALLLHSGIADVTDEDKFPEDIEAERAARALVNETKEALDGK